MSKYVEKNLNAGEKQLGEIKRTPWILFSLWLWAIIFIVIGVVASLLPGAAGEAIGGVSNEYMAEAVNDGVKQVVTPIIVVAVFFVLRAIIKTLRYYKTYLTITDKRVIYRTGILTTNSIDIPFEKINAINIKQKFWGKIFHYAYIKVDTSSLETDIHLDGVVQADKFKNTIMEQVEAKKAEEARIQAEATARAMKEAMAGMMNNNQNTNN